MQQYTQYTKHYKTIYSLVGVNGLSSTRLFSVKRKVVFNSHISPLGCIANAKSLQYFVFTITENNDNIKLDSRIT